MMHKEDEKIDILVVDDTIDNIKLLDSLLTYEGYNVTGASSGNAAIRICQNKRVDLILLDIMMPKMDGYQVCKQLKSDPKTRDIPVIFLSALDSTQDKVRAFQVGAADYIQKPFETLEVLARVKTHTEVLLLQRKLIARNHELRKLAETDGLTGLMNRRKMTEIGHRQTENYSVALFDVDDFKMLNDQYGHHVGDRELIAIADLSKQVIGLQGHVARWGGEEFLVLLPDTELHQATQLMQSLRSAFVQSNQILSTATFGVVHNSALDDFSSTVKAADQAMYQGKHNGKNQVVTCDMAENDNMTESDPAL
ncbi:diguanylate cyclase [Vibrio taketomensis]|uniref:diguanylate cyclase n=1 Tax=Vibrio taketomensis TaxID=2572923 RepID=UPI001E5DB955|nr:diguanylate cyclase [Vibrio taketomensis]